jgi:hypothetical protein
MEKIGEYCGEMNINTMKVKINKLAIIIYDGVNHIGLMLF